MLFTWLPSVIHFSYTLGYSIWMDIKDPRYG